MSVRPLSQSVIFIYISLPLSPLQKLAKPDEVYFSLANIEDLIKPGVMLA
jgi:hypothetical protein